MSKVLIAGTEAASLHSRQDEAARDEVMAEYYQTVFDTSSEAARHVVADLVIATQYFDTLPDTATDAELRAHNARRSVFQRILNMADIAPERIARIKLAIERIDAARVA